MINNEIANIFNSFANIYEIMADELEENDKQIKFKTRAYRQGALTLENLSQDLKAIVNDPETKLENLPGVGKAMADKIREYIQTGKIKAYEKLKALVPPGLLEMLEIPGLGPKKVKLFYTSLGVSNLEQLAVAIKAGEIEQLPRMGKKSAEKILDAIDRYQSQPKRFPLGIALKEVESIITEIKACPAVQKITYAGSARRQKVTVGDIDIICSSTNPAAVMDFFKQLPVIEEMIADGDTKISVYLKSGIQLDLRVVQPDEFGAAIQYFTGSKAHNVKLRTIAKNMGYKISEYGIFKTDTGEKVGGEYEEDIYITLNMQTPPPEIRENTGEIEMSQKKSIPQLIEISDVRGDLHNHSTFSDGKLSIEAMAEAAIKLGYQYIAITDHSPAVGITNGLSPQRLIEKQKEIAALNEKMPITILHGTEVDILADGSLDYDDDILKELDIVVASIHLRLNQDNTDRIIAAMKNPYVHIIGHPSTRLINKREPSPNDWTKIFQTAAETNTILEINASPMRLDLEGSFVREAKKFGCKFTINTDAHNDNSLKFMRHGIGQARRGHLEAKDVINTYSWAEIQKIIK